MARTIGNTGVIARRFSVSLAVSCHSEAQRGIPHSFCHLVSPSPKRIAVIQTANSARRDDRNTGVKAPFLFSVGLKPSFRSAARNPSFFFPAGFHRQKNSPDSNRELSMAQPIRNTGVKAPLLCVVGRKLSFRSAARNPSFFSPLGFHHPKKVALIQAKNPAWRDLSENSGVIARRYSLSLALSCHSEAQRGIPHSFSCAPEFPRPLPPFLFAVLYMVIPNKVRNPSGIRRWHFSAQRVLPLSARYKLPQFLESPFSRWRWP